MFQSGMGLILAEGQHSLPHPIHFEDIGLARRFEGDHRRANRLRNGDLQFPKPTPPCSTHHVTKMTQNRRGAAEN
jgi:hypothetical protein